MLLEFDGLYKVGTVRNESHGLEMVKNTTFSGIIRTINSFSNNPIVWTKLFSIH